MISKPIILLRRVLICLAPSILKDWLFADMIIAMSLQKGGREFSFLEISSFLKISSGLFLIYSFKVIFSGDNVW